jgi:hypothetical protein
MTHVKFCWMVKPSIFTRYKKYAESFLRTEAPLDNNRIHTNTNSSEAGHITHRHTVFFIVMLYSPRPQQDCVNA